MDSQHIFPVSNHYRPVLIDTEKLDIDDDDHFSNSIETPLRADAFDLSDEEKMDKISHHFTEIIKTLGLDLEDDSIKGTPRRVAKMYVKEIFKGLDPKNKPGITLFDNKYGYSHMLVEKDIAVNSYCEHHFVPIIGKAHVAYYSSGKVVGLSKINRIVQYYSKRPQVQERLTEQIAHELKKMLNTEDVAILIEASHMCVTIRGVKDPHSTTVTASYHGKFRSSRIRDEFLKYVKGD